ncbi:MAG: adenosylcobalamin-dependent ribonucleoside-diphosphate reductase [Paracoccaceae bacterium]|nr:adenosylcobalamin-dependent ribonucleoside-diphosphate reductase [Paracoccaceae bacterium]
MLKVHGSPVESFDQPISEQIWRSKYQYVSNGKVIDHCVRDTWVRVGDSLAQPEHPGERAQVSKLFLSAMEEFKLLPAGRILAGAGTHRNVTLANTFVMRTIPDSLAGIMDTVKDAALTMQMGGGIGFDFSTLRPKGDLVQGLDCPAAGPLAAMDILDAVCKMLVAGTGRGAMMATMRVDHPDIEAFIEAKSDPSRLRNFNTSVMISDPFMKAVDLNSDWDLVWNDTLVKRVNARELWEKIMRRTYDAAEPGVLFIDRINASNPLGYLEDLRATNSCAEQPLPPNGTCPLASINLARLVTHPFSSQAELDMQQVEHLVRVAVRMLDNSIEVTRFAVAAQLQEAQQKRRIGVGVTGVADALIMVGVRYGTAKAERLVESWLRAIQNMAYLTSAQLAAERGAFPLYDANAHQQGAGIMALDAHVRRAISMHGLRNGVLTTIAPTGTTSMYGGNVSSGIEPVFATTYKRKIARADGTKSEEAVEDYAVWLYRQMFGTQRPLTDAFVTAQDLRPTDHIRMQAAAQRWIDSGISKTVNCPEDIPFAVFEDVYRQAYETGCKGCTTYRPNAITGSVLST